MPDCVHYPVYFTTIKMKSLALLAILFYLIASHMNSLRTLNPLFYFLTIIEMKSLTRLTILLYFTAL